MKIVISVVEFNTKDLLEKCLTQIYDEPVKNKLEVWIVDNNSEDDSIQMIEKKFPQVKLIKNQKNVGFGKAHNQVLKKAQADYFLVLNPDTQFNVTDIDQMTEFMQQHPSCGISSCKITDFKGKLQSNGGDLPFSLSLISWLFNLELFGNFPNFHRQDKSYYQNAHTVGWVGGTFMFIRNEVIKKNLAFNEDYFMYFEDTQFCLDARKKGFEIMINPAVSIKHLGGASSKDPHLRQWLGEVQGLLYFYSKYFGAELAAVVKGLVYIAIILRIIAFSLLGKQMAAKTYGKILFKI